MERNRRLGTIIKTIANQPGITMSGLHAELLAGGIDITERTLAKDILKLKREFGLLPDQERLRKGYFLRDVCTLSSSELGLVMDAMHAFGTRLSDLEARAMLDRLTKITDVKLVQSRTLGHRNIYKKSTQEIEGKVLTAIRSHTAMSIVYETPRIGQPQTIEGYPLLLVFHERGWYCIMRDLKTKQYQPRRIDRIRECKLLEKLAVNESHAEDLKEAQFLMSCGWGMSFPRNVAEMKKADDEPEIVVRFERSVAGYILESLDRHPKGRVRSARDGTGAVEFRIRLSNTQEFQYWVRSFGSKAWIVAPPSLVEKERAEVRRMAQKYGMNMR